MNAAVRKVEQRLPITKSTKGKHDPLKQPDPITKSTKEGARTAMPRKTWVADFVLFVIGSKRQS